MGQLYLETEQYLSSVNGNSVFVEIGSERGEGSTSFFANIAKKHNIALHTVDVVDHARTELSTKFDNIIWHINTGSVWASDIFPTFDKTISCVYLDNFDYIWDIDDIPKWTHDQIEQYKQDFNIIMNNQNCQVEHLKQIMELEPFIEKDGLVICDDTHRWNDCWVGKAGAVVVFLLAKGYEIIREKEFGVVLINKAL